jgi:hypothetical protein
LTEFRTKFTRSYLLETPIEQLVQDTIESRRTGIPGEADGIYDRLRDVSFDKALDFREKLNEHDRQFHNYDWIDFSKTTEFGQRATPTREAQLSDSINTRLAALEQRITTLELQARKS